MYLQSAQILEARLARVTQTHALYVLVTARVTSVFWGKCCDLTDLDRRLVEAATIIDQRDFAAAAAVSYRVEFWPLKQTIGYWLQLARSLGVYQQKLAEAQSAQRLQCGACTPQQIAHLQRNGVSWAFQLFEFCEGDADRNVIVLWDTNKGALGLPFYPAAGSAVSIWPDNLPFCSI